MYSMVLAAVLTTGANTPDWGRCHGCFGGCNGCFGCYGGNAFSCMGCSGCFGCYGGCFGGCYGGCFGGGFGCYGCYGGGFGCYGCYGGFASYGCFGCYGGGYSVGYGGHGCYGCSGGVVVIYRQAPPRKGGKGGGKNGDMNKNGKNGKGDKNGDDEARVRPDRATVVVHLPADARLYVDNVLCPLNSNKRTFQTPPLEKGRKYYYTIKARAVREGKPVQESRKVYVAAGKKVRVDFGDLTTTVRTAKKR